MDELQEGLKNTVTKDIAIPVQEKIREITKDWGLSLPDVPALVFDFGLGIFDEIGETEYWIANEKGYGYCGKFLFLFSFQRCPEHMHKIKHETFFIVRGKLEMRTGMDERIMSSGDTLAVEPGTWHTFKALEDTLILEVSMPGIIADNYFTDSKVGYIRKKDSK